MANELSVQRTNAELLATLNKADNAVQPAQLTEAITTEATYRQEQVDSIEESLQDHADELLGRRIFHINGAFMSLVPGGMTPIPKSIFESGLTDGFKSAATPLRDDNGTLGWYIGDVDSATINVLTAVPGNLSGIANISLGEVGTYATLPTNISDPFFTQTPTIGNFVRIVADENAGGGTTERSIIFIETDGAIKWGNPIRIPSGDFQAQTDSTMAGKVLTGGANAGTYGEPLDVDTTPTADSNNLIKSGGVAAELKANYVNVNNPAQMNANLRAQNSLRSTAVTAGVSNVYAGTAALANGASLPAGCIYIQYS